MQKMNAPLQYRLDHADLALVLALVRGGSLARAAELLRVDVSTVFRAIRRLEKNLGKAFYLAVTSWIRIMYIMLN